MAKTADKTDPKLWEAVKAEVTESDKGGRPGQWSARKAQLSTQAYKKRGGGYEGERGEDNHLRQWQREAWGTKSGRKSTDTGERYLPKAAREELSADEYRRTTEKKRADTRAGRQHSSQPADVARKAARHRDAAHVTAPTQAAPTKGALMAEARRRNVAGRSRMSKEALQRALAE